MFGLVFLKMGVWYIKIIDIVPFRTVYRKYAQKMCRKVQKSAQSVKKLSSASEILHRALCNNNVWIPHLQKDLGPPLLPTLCYFWADKVGYFIKGEGGSN